MEELEIARVIIDTDLLIDLLRDKEESRTFVSELEKRRCLLATTAVNAFELYHGAHKSNQREKALQSTYRLLKRLVILPLSPRSARRAGQILAILEAKGQLIGLRDTLIGAIALTRGFSVATRDIEHFMKIAELRIVSPENL